MASRSRPRRSAGAALRIASFNVQIFGHKKLEHKRVFEILVQIVRRYDVILIQEIRDASGTSIGRLVDAVNSRPPRSKQNAYEYVVSARLGRTASKEQYAFVYRKETVSLLDKYQFDDSVKDEFEREPFCVKLHLHHAVVPEVVLIGLHVDPDTVEKELRALADVHATVCVHFDTDNVIMMGDFNSDTQYISIAKLDSLPLRADRKFSWLISDDVDTTTCDSDFTYDRFIVTGEALKSSIVPNSAVVFRYDQEYLLSERMTERVSDHYPIELLIKLKK